MHVSVQSFEPLIARTGSCAHCGFGGSGDLVIDRDIVDVYVINSNAVAALPQGWVFLQLFHFGFLSAVEPAVAHVDSPNDGYSSSCSATYRDISRMGECFQIDRAADLKRTLKRSLDGCGGR